MQGRSFNDNAKQNFAVNAKRLWKDPEGESAQLDRTHNGSV